MRIIWLALVTISVFWNASQALADQVPTIKGSVVPTASEQRFVSAMQADLGRRFPTATAAEAAGYFRYTNEDNTGAISYANLHWASKDVHHPSQLWYSKDGTLLGADYSVLNVTNMRPHQWGIQSGRWYEFDDHIHYVTKDRRTGSRRYDQYVDPISDYIKAGGDPKHPDAAILVKMHRVTSTSDVVRIFDFPAIWDLIVWVKPNPAGAFAEKNPDVKR